MQYVPDKEAICWTLKQFPGQKDFIMNAKFHLPTVISSNRENFAKKPVSIDFEIPYFTVSGF